MDVNEENLLLTTFRFRVLAMNNSQASFNIFYKENFIISSFQNDHYTFLSSSFIGHSNQTAITELFEYTEYDNILNKNWA